MTRARRGFTLLEVMIGLALLGLALTVLLKSAAGSIFNARQAQMMGVVTELARAKMYDVEEQLLKDGFTETGLADADDECTDFEPFDEEGWPEVAWCAKVEQVELPSWQALQALAKGAGEAAGEAAGSAAAAADAELGSAAPTGGFQDSALGGMLSMLGGGLGGDGGGDIDAQMGASFIQGQYAMVQQVLKVSIRKVTVTVRWRVLGSERDMKVVAFFTDAAAMDKVLSGMGSQELPDDPGTGGGAAGGGTGRGTGAPTRTPRPFGGGKP